MAVFGHNSHVFGPLASVELERIWIAVASAAVTLVIGVVAFPIYLNFARCVRWRRATAAASR